MSSHREAPEISKDPVADNTDVYAFVSPDNPATVTFITNFVPLQDPPAGRTSSSSATTSPTGSTSTTTRTGSREIGYLFMFNTTVANPDTFLYNTGPITSLDSPNWNRRQFYSVWRVDGDDVTTYQHGSPMKVTLLGRNLPCPPCNIGPRSTPNYASLAQSAVQGRRQRRQTCSPGSAKRASTSTSGRSSTSATCGRSSTCT